MKIFIALLALAICAQAHLNNPNPGIAFPEQMRSMPGGRIIDGSPAVEGQIPYQGFVISSSSSGSRSACGASLLSARWVLTAAHCVSGYITADVHLGSISHADSPVIVQTYNLIVYPEYSSLNIRNDIGLIGFPNDVPLSSNIQPIGLPANPSVTYTGQHATVSGFGLTTEGGTVSPVLHYAQVQVITNLACLVSYPLYVRDTILCTLGVDNEAQGTCNGDSGGPLVLMEGGVLKQIGVVSFGSSSGCLASSPKGYTRPYHYIRWISAVTGINY